jgi:hypothetical protein
MHHSYAKNSTVTHEKQKYMNNNWFSIKRGDSLGNDIWNTCMIKIFKISEDQIHFLIFYAVCMCCNSVANFNILKRLLQQNFKLIFYNYKLTKEKLSIWKLSKSYLSYFVLEIFNNLWYAIYPHYDVTLNNFLEKTSRSWDIMYRNIKTVHLCYAKHNTNLYYISTNLNLFAYNMF